MNELESHLDAAEKAGVLAPGQAQRLSSFITARMKAGDGGNGETSGGLPDLDTPRGEELNQLEAAEAPRFVRGFHDILITVGIVLAVVGVAMVGSALAVIPVAWVLAEIFVKRQNLALPAVCLTVAMAVAALYSTLALVMSLEIPEVWSFSLILVVQFSVMLVFYWRFRVPLSLAGCIAAAFFLVYAFIMSIWFSTTDVQIFEDPLSARVAGGLAIVLAVNLFLVAMWFDARDINRVTRRSDVAFWLHACAAPAILYGLLMAVFAGNAQLGDNFTIMQALVVVLIVMALMITGIVVDRRMFVTSGLLSLGGAVYALSASLDLGITDYTALTVLIVGLIVLSLGSGWVMLRGIIVPRLPDMVRNRVPPVHGVT